MGKLYGIYDTEGFMGDVNNGDIARSACGYYAAWIATDGRIHSVDAHVSLRGNYNDAFAEGFVRIMFDMRPGFGIELRDRKLTMAQCATIETLCTFCDAEWSYDYKGTYRRFTSVSSFNENIRVLLTDREGVSV
jgi:hypothetical protein